MENVNSFLIEWCIRFLESKDAINQDIIKIERNKGGFDFIVHNKCKVKSFTIAPELDKDILKKINNQGNYGIFTLNSKLNLNFLLNEWKRLTGFKSLTLYFINPLSNNESVWIINPYIHDKVCDNSSLELGLRSLAESVDPISKEILTEKIK